MSNRRVEREIEIGYALPAAIAHPIGSLAFGFVAVRFSEQKAQTMRMSGLLQRKDPFSQLDSGQRPEGMWWSCDTQPESRERQWPTANKGRRRHVHIPKIGQNIEETA